MLINTNYQDKWESRSSIRSRPRKLINFELEGDFFPQEKQVLMLVPEVNTLDKQKKQEILIQSFYKYLHDIIVLEAELIISACNTLIYKDFEFNFTEQLKLDAYTVIIDEYYHIYVARDMLNQLHGRFGKLYDLNYSLSDSYNSVIQIKDKLDSKYHNIFDILAVCIFETTLVRELVEFFKSENIHQSIKYYVNDHMNDEARHYAFFFDLLGYIWSNISEEYKSAIGEHLGDFIKLYLNINSEKHFNYQLLNLILNDGAKASKIIEQLYMDFDISGDIPIVNNVLSVLEKLGISEYPAVRNSLKQANLYIIKESY